MALRPTRSVLAFALVAALAGAAAPGAPAAAAPTAPAAVPGEVVVAPEGDGAPRVVDASPAAARRLAERDDVRFVEPNYLFTASALPTDPLVGDQWALADPDALGAADAWTLASGEGVLVAVLDTGVQHDHPDLAGRVWRNPREIPGNGIDDDANGYVDDVWGANTVSGAGDAHDDEGHGTHVAGIIAATANNSIGGVGLAPAATIMPVKVLDSRRAGTASGLAAGVRYAVANGARIINASVNGDGASQVLQEAIAEAHAAGVTVVASAGNNSRDIDVAPSYPASYPEANVLSVTAVDEGGLLPSFANRGPRGVDLAAPGTDILSTARGSGFERRSGTSMAAPFVAGALALLADARPDLPAAEARAALLGTARAQSGLAGLIGTGRLDAAAGLRRVLGAARRQPAVAAATAPVARRAVAKKRTVRPTLLTPRRVRAGRVALRWSRGTTSGVRRWRVALDGRRVATVRAGRALHIRTAVRPGRHRYSVTGLDGAGRRVAVAVKRFRAVRPRR